MSTGKQWDALYGSESNGVTRPAPTQAQLSAIRLQALRERLSELDLWTNIDNVFIYETAGRKIYEYDLIERRMAELKKQIDEIAFSELVCLIPKEEDK